MSSVSDCGQADPLCGVETMCDVFRKRVELSGDKPWLTLYSGDRVSRVVSFAGFSDEVAGWAALLSEKGVGPGDRVLIVLPTELAFYSSYWAVSAMGAVPVPAYPPVRLSRMEEYLCNLAGIANNCGAGVLITSSKIAPLLAGLGRLVKHELVQALTSEAGSLSRDAGTGGSTLLSNAHSNIRAGDLALLQYTSGSTGNQKGVMLTHANLIANIRAIGAKIGIKPSDAAVSWLPLYHDMGLIGLMLGTFCWGIELAAMSPIDFLKKPVRWLRVMSDHKATLTAAPNFAFNLAARKAKPGDLEGMDLSPCRMALCGAEPIYPATIESFSSVFGPVGFRREAFFPAYGLAENTLAAAFSEVGRLPRLIKVDAQKLEREGFAEPAGEGVDSKTMVGVGTPLDGMEIKIIGEDGSFLPEGRRGEVAVGGTSVMSGYYGAPEATSSALADGLLRSGDLGFILDGCLYICGRKKDMIIKGGKNFFAEDIEAAASRISGVKPGGVCAFAVDDAKRGTEKVLVAVEVRPDADAGSLGDTVRKRISSETGCRPDEVILLPPKTLPKTSSGKIQRFKTKQWFLDGSLTSRGGEKKTVSFFTYATAWMQSKIGFRRR